MIAKLLNCFEGAKSPALHLWDEGDAALLFHRSFVTICLQESFFMLRLLSFFFFEIIS